MENVEYYLVHSVNGEAKIHGHSIPIAVENFGTPNQIYESFKVNEQVCTELEQSISSISYKVDDSVWYIVARNTETNACDMEVTDVSEVSEFEDYILFTDNTNCVFNKNTVTYVRRNGIVFTFTKSTGNTKCKSLPSFLCIRSCDAEVMFSENYSNVLELKVTKTDNSKRRINPNKVFVLQEFKDYLEKEGLLYSDIDLINFHACVDSNYLTIVSGFSGTGKSALTAAYVRFMSTFNGIEDESRHVMIPVSPNFTDPTSVCGYYNYETGVYTPDKNGFMNTVREANQPGNEDKIYYVIFDEINLAPVEKWFCDFISKMESGDDLFLFDEDEGKKSASLKYRYRYKLKNLKFLGTMNENETDLSLNLRVLDRASKVILEPPDLESIIDLYIKNHNLKPGRQMTRFIDIVKALDRTTRDTLDFLKDRERKYSNIGKFFISPRMIITSIDYLKSAESISDNQIILEKLMDKLFSQRLFSKLNDNDNPKLMKEWRDQCSPENLNLKDSYSLLNQRFTAK